MPAKTKPEGTWKGAYELCGNQGLCDQEDPVNVLQ